MKVFLNGLTRGFGFSAGISIFVALAALLAQSLSSFASGDLVSASTMNANFQAVKTPDGAIMAFYLSACPTGWIPADGSNSTPDLRGLFIRGRDDFGTGAAGRDPSGVRAIGNMQNHGFQDHGHGMSGGQILRSVTPGGSDLSIQGGPRTLSYVNATETITSGNSTTETRPSNVALIYCMKTGS